MILLDTHALVWLETGHPRARPLVRAREALCISPITLLEVQMLAEIGRVKLRGASGAADFVNDERWTLDEPPAGLWFEESLGISWTRDPFDRLLVAHARARRFRLATADARLLEHLGTREVLKL